MNAALAFGEDHENSQEPIFKMFDQLFRCNLKPDDVVPLHVFAKSIPGETDVPGEGLGLFSRRRLIALLMCQAVRRDEAVMAQCYTCTEEDLKRYPNKRAWFDQEACFLSSLASKDPGRDAANAKASPQRGSLRGSPAPVGRSSQRGRRPEGS